MQRSKHTCPNCLFALNVSDLVALIGPSKTSVQIECANRLLEFSACIRNNYFIFLGLLIETCHQDMASIWRPGWGLKSGGRGVDPVLCDIGPHLQECQMIWRGTLLRSGMNDHCLSIRSP